MPQAKPTSASPAVQPGAPLQIFKPGRHTAMSGQALTFAESDLQATVAAYDPAKHEAPLVVGHPKADLPAYGWVQSLAFCDGAIDATPAQVNADFADMVAAGAFKKISAAFYGPDAPGNPVPGVFYLRHVGFLGAQPPAVKGLRNPAFAEAEEGVVTFSEWDDMTNAGLWRNLREWILGKFGPEEADKVLPGYDVRALELGAQEEINQARAEAEVASAAPIPAFTEPQRQESTVTEAEAALLRTQATAQAARIAELEAEKRATALATTHAANVAFCEGLAAEGRLLPAFQAVAVATLDHFATQAAPVEFGEGEAKAPLAEAFKGLLAALPKAVEFGETATAVRAAPDAGVVDHDDAAFSESADPDRLAQHRAIRAYMTAHKVDYQTAARAVIK